MLSPPKPKSSIDFILNSPQSSADHKSSPKSYSATYPPQVTMEGGNGGLDHLLSAASILGRRDAMSSSTRSSSSYVSSPEVVARKGAERSRSLSKPPSPEASSSVTFHRSSAPAMANVSALAPIHSSSSSNPTSQEALHSSSSSSTLREDTSIQKSSKRRRRQNIHCDVCGRAFGDSSSARKHHRVVHLKIKEFECEECGKTFAEKSNRSKHYIAAHLNQRSHPCPDCDKVFNFTDGLRRHRNNVHLGLRPYQCGDCNTWYKQKTHLLKHRQAVHGVVLPPKRPSE